MANRAARSDGRNPLSTSIDAPLRRRFALRTLGHFDDDLIAFARAVPISQFDFNRIPVTRIFRLHVAAALAGVPDPADQRRRIADALDQPRYAPAALIHSHSEHFDAIVVHQSRGVGARQYQRRRAVIRHHQYIAIGAAAHASRDPLAIAGDREAIRPFNGLAIAHHGGQAFGERLTLRVRAHPQALGEPRGAQRFRRLAQMLQQQFAARNRIGVARLLMF